jgi:hypothetical protein
MPYAQLMSVHSIVVLQIPGAPSDALPLVERQQMPADVVFGGLMKTVSSQLRLIDCAIGEIDLAAKRLHLADEPGVVMAVGHHILERCGNVPRWGQQNQAVIQGIYRSLKQSEHRLRLSSIWLAPRKLAEQGHGLPKSKRLNPDQSQEKN